MRDENTITQQFREAVKAVYVRRMREHNMKDYANKSDEQVMNVQNDAIADKSRLEVVQSWIDEKRDMTGLQIPFFRG